MKRLAVIALAACGSAPPPPAPVHNVVPENVPRVDVAIASGASVKLLHTTANGLVVDREVVVPAIVSRMVWSGADPVVWLDLPIDPMTLRGDDPSPPGPHASELGRITAKGYTSLPAPSWRRATRAPDGEPPGDTHVEPAIEGLIAVEGGQTWASHCEWGFIADGIQCSETVYARVDDGSPAVVDTTPKGVYTWGSKLLPKQEGPAGYALALSKHTDDSAGYGRETTTLACTGPDGGFELPPQPDPEYSRGFDTPTWISTSPPLFEVDQLFDGYVGYAEQRFFAGCKRAPEYSSAVSGPDDTVWLTGAKLEVYYHGRKIGETDPGTLAFHVGPR